MDDSHHRIVGTTPSDTAYHACHRTLTKKAAYGLSCCGKRCHLTPRPWDRERQKRQDSCHRCVAVMKKVYQAID
jgi:hypothetical protein